MFDVGFSELVLLFVIGLLILGPERLPRVAAQLGRWVGRARRTATQLRMQFEREMTMQDIMKQQKHKPQESQKPHTEQTPPGEATDAAQRQGPADSVASAPQAPGTAADEAGAEPSESPAKPAERVDEPN